MKQRILLFGYQSPPVFGPSVAYETLLRTEFARHFDVTFINLSVVQSVRELETFRAGKLMKLAKFFAMELWYLLTRRFAVCCYPISYNSRAFLKDRILIGLAQFFRVPVVLWAHGTGARRFRDSMSNPRPFDRLLASASAVLVLADCLHAEFEGLVPAERIHTITIGIEPAPATEPVAADGSGPTILSLGVLSKRKGIFDVLESMPRVIERVPEAQLVVAGTWFNPDEEEWAADFVRRHELGKVVRFVGPVQGRAKWDLLRRADVFVFAPYHRSEAFGIVLLEAMQAGVPIVATRGGARDEIMTDGVNGLLCDEGNPAGLAARVCEVLRDPELRCRMREANQARFRDRYTADLFGRRMIEILEQCISKGSALSPTGRQP